MRLVYLSPVPWASFAQRSHKFVEWFHAKAGGEVLWIDPYPTRLPVLSDLRRTSTRASGAKVKIPDWLTVMRPSALPIEPIAGSGFLNRLLWRDVLVAVDEFVARGDCQIGVGKPSELALQVLGRTPDKFSFSDAMDNFPAFYEGLSRKAMGRREREVATRVAKILVSSSALQDRFAVYCDKVVVVRNACAVDTFPSVDLLPKVKRAPVFGYVGTIGHWFDWPLVCALAEVNPSLCIRLIGPTYTLPPGPVPHNIELFPPCDHAAAIRAMQEFSVGLIPFKRTDLTASVDPIKYYEYRALGLPVLSTRFGEMALRDGQAGVFLMNGRSDLATQVKTSRAYECERHEILQFRNANSWEVRFDASGILP
jgi:hypothetical protein